MCGLYYRTGLVIKNFLKTIFIVNIHNTLFKKVYESLTAVWGETQKPEEIEQIEQIIEYYFDDKNIDEALPSTPIEILGINGAAKSGDDFIVLESEKEAKTLSANRAEERKEGKNPLSFATQESPFTNN